MAKIVLTKSMGLKIEMKRFVMLGLCHFLELGQIEKFNLLNQS